jgi:hypothetical protein
MAVVAWAGNHSAASRALKDQNIDLTPTTLSLWTRETYAARFQEMREKYSEQLEQQLIHEYRDVARLAVDVQRLALDKATTRLERGDDGDPGRTAANAARVAQAMTDKMLSLSGRPTSIREDRNLNEIMRSLVAKGILQMPDEPAELPAAVVE